MDSAYKLRDYLYNSVREGLPSLSLDLSTHPRREQQGLLQEFTPGILIYMYLSGHPWRVSDALPAVYLLHFLVSNPRPLLLLLLLQDLLPDEQQGYYFGNPHTGREPYVPGSFRSAAAPKTRT